MVLTKILHKNLLTVWRYKEGSNLNYVIMAVDEHDELPEATQREAELQRQIDDLQGQVTRLHRAREDT